MNLPMESPSSRMIGLAGRLERRIQLFITSCSGTTTLSIPALGSHLLLVVEREAKLESSRCPAPGPPSSGGAILFSCVCKALGEGRESRETVYPGARSSGDTMRLQSFWFSVLAQSSLTLPGPPLGKSSSCITSFLCHWGCEGSQRNFIASCTSHSCFPQSLCRQVSFLWGLLGILNVSLLPHCQC